MSGFDNISPAEMKKLKSIPFTSYDFGWVLLCIGMAIGAGTVLMPIQIGLKGIWVFILAFIIAYPCTYIVQDMYIRTLSRSDSCDDYTDIITQYLGKNWGMILGIIYFLMLIHGMFIYSLSVIFDSASYLQTYGVTQGLLSDSLLYRIVVFTFLVFIASHGEKLLFKISGPMVIIKIAIIVLLGLIMIPHWNWRNITAFPEWTAFLRDVLLTVPFAFFSAVFIQILNPMNIAYRKREKDRIVATWLTIRTHRISYIILISIILFFSFSFTFSISHDEAVAAFHQNISALALATQVIPGELIHIISTILNVFAVLTAFFGIYLGFHESIHGIVTNILCRFMKKDSINKTVLNLAVCVFIIAILVMWVSLGFSVLIFFQIGSPLYGIVSCLIPCYLIYKVARLHDLQGYRFWIVFAFGILLCISPFLKFLE